MRTHITLFFWFAASILNNAYTQNNLSPQQTHRLADAGKLWGYIKYFHPYAQTKRVNLDSAFAASVPSIIAAKNKTDYIHSLEKFLSVLDDPLTTIIQDSAAQSSKVPLRYFIQDSVLYVDAANYVSLTGGQEVQYADTLKKAYEQLENVNRIVFDIRRKDKNSSEDNVLVPLFRMVDPLRHLVSKPIYGPANRTIAHKGFIPELWKYENCPYLDYFKQSTFPIFEGKAPNGKPVIIIVNKASHLPPLFLAMQKAGTAGILQQTAAGDITGSFLEYYAADSVLVKIRTGESINIDGTKGFVPDDVYTADANDSLIFAKAKTVQLKGRKLEPPVVDTFVSFPTPFFEEQGVFPPLGYRVLGAAKIYTIIDHFYYDKRLMDSGWNKMYEKYLPLFVAAKDSMDYIKAVASFYAHIQDGHGAISSTPYYKLIHAGYYSSPVFASIKENKMVVTAIVNDSGAKADHIEIGDVIEKADGKDVMTTINELRKYHPAGNYAAQGSYLTRTFLTKGYKDSRNDSILLQIRDRYANKRTVVLHMCNQDNDYYDAFKEALQGQLKRASFKLLAKDIGYVDLRILKKEEVDSMFTLFSKTKALIFDMRGYPKTGASMYVAKRLTGRKAFTAVIMRHLIANSPDVDAINTDEVDQDEVMVYNQKLDGTQKSVYEGKTVLLMNETTQSQAEHAAMYLKSSGNTTFIGTPTAGANGTITYFSIPGKVKLSFSGMNVSMGNGKPMQRIGLQPDVYVAPTIKGIQQGKDEVLNKAIGYLRNLLH